MLQRTAFSLIELLVAIAILGVVAAIVVPKLTNIKSQADAATQTGNIASLTQLFNEWLAAGGVLATPGHGGIDPGGTAEGGTLPVPSGNDNEKAVAFFGLMCSPTSTNSFSSTDAQSGQVFVTATDSPTIMRLTGWQFVYRNDGNQIPGYSTVGTVYCYGPGGEVLTVCPDGSHNLWGIDDSGQLYYTHYTGHSDWCDGYDGTGRHTQ